jgi:hypothetical protein
MRAFLERTSKRLLRTGLRRGVTESSDLWLAIGALALLVRVLSKRDKPATVTERLKVGESITVTNLPPPPARRAARRAAGAGRAEP